jgi:hypothetical protein
MSETLKFGNGQWATKVGSTLAYNDEEETSNHYLLTLQEAQVEQGLIKMV